MSSTTASAAPFAHALVSRAFGSPRLRTDGDPVALAFADDDTLWTIEEPGVLRQWDGQGNPLGRHFLSDLETLWVFSPRAVWLASASDDLLLWDVASQQLIASIPQPSWVTAVAFAPDLSLVATGHDDGYVRLWDAGRKQLIGELSKHGGPVSALAFRDDGQRLASAGEDRVIRIWDVPGRKAVTQLPGHTDRIPALAWQPGTDLLVSAGWDTTARLWDVDAGEPLMLLNTHADQVLQVQFSPSGDLLACIDSAPSVHVWADLRRGQTVQVLPGYADEMRGLAFRQDGKLLAVIGTDRVVRLWEPRTGALVAGPVDHARPGLALAGPTEAPLLASTAGGAGVSLALTGEAVALPGFGGPRPAVAASADGRWLAAARPDRGIDVWDVIDRTPPKHWDCPTAPTTALAWSPDGKHLLSGCGSAGTVWLWDFNTGEPALLIPEAAESCSVEAVAYHPNGRWIVAGGIDWLSTSGSDGVACLWDVAGRQRLKTFDAGVLALAIHPEGRWLACVTIANALAIFDLHTGETVREIPKLPERTQAVAYSPDGRYLATGSDDHSLRMWTADGGTCEVVREFDTPLQALAFSADSKTLYTANGNTTCYALDVAELLK